jgi:cytochrome bd-type quinol oxidase subunit 1
VKGLDAFPPDRWPDNIPLLYYSYHIMVGLGTIFIAVMALAALNLWRGALYRSRPVLWLLMLMLPFPYIANTAGWITAEVGRQPWLVYGMMRTLAGFLAAHLRRQRPVHADRLHGNLHHPRHSLSLSGLSRNRRGPGAAEEPLSPAI